MVFEMNLAPAPFEKIRSGSKDVELRLYDEKRRRLNIGDEIIFTNLSDKDEQITVRINALYRYGSFRDLFEEIPPQRCGCDADISAEAAAAGMRKYYSEQLEYQYGVLGIRMELIDLDVAQLTKEQQETAMLEYLFPDGMK